MLGIEASGVREPSLNHSSQNVLKGFPLREFILVFLEG